MSDDDVSATEDAGSSELDEGIVAEQGAQVGAMVGVLGRLAGLSELPPVFPDWEPVPLPELRDSVEFFSPRTERSTAQHLPPTVRLELLARLVRSGALETLDDVDAVGMAQPLTAPDSVDSGQELLGRLRGWVTGTDPLGHTTLQDLVNVRSQDASLPPEIQCSTLSVRPGCGAANMSVRGIQALSIVTEMWTCRPFEEFKSLIHPKTWPKCWLQSHFFRSMEERPPPKATAPHPDVPEGSRETLRETVDFGFGLLGAGTGELRTDLDVVYFCNEEEAGAQGAAQAALGAPLGGPGWPPSVELGAAAPAGAGALAVPDVRRSPVAVAGCTYDLNRSVDGRILVDQGYLLVEDIPGRDYRRYRTQKEVRFAWGNPAASAVCGVWSIAAGLIVQFC